MLCSEFYMFVLSYLYTVLNIYWLFELCSTFQFKLSMYSLKFLARPTSRCRRTESIVSLEIGVSSCAEMQVFFLLREAERKHVRRRARFQQHRDASYHQVVYFCNTSTEGNSRLLKETLGEHAPSYATVKNWVVQFKRGDFSTCDAPRPGRPKTMTTPEFVSVLFGLRTYQHPLVLSFQSAARYIYLLQSVHTNIHSAVGPLYAWKKRPGQVGNNSIHCQVYEWVELYFQSLLHRVFLNFRVT
jgi:hypothetical protein